MSTDNGIHDSLIILEADVLQKRMEFLNKLHSAYYKRIIKLERDMRLIENTYNEQVSITYVNYIFYIASVESMLLYLYIG